ncbi:uncharacterized protein [Brachyistius frenatus]|uniref:uncharacterized protein n=1 Tax=Brachyistius frenatus TaxID=100188 RepID=UPI0037E82CE0
MDSSLRTHLLENSLNYKRSLYRIVDKYSKLQYQDGGIEVDLDDVKPPKLEYYVRVSKKRLSMLESKSLTDLREETIRANRIAGDSQLDFTYQDDGADKTFDSISQFSTEDDDNNLKATGMNTSDVSHLTVSLLDESSIQPEDHDEELQMTLRSHCSSLVALYPSMIGRIEKAWRRQQDTTAADSVLRRYRRWRHQPNRSRLNNTLVVVPRHASVNLKKTTSQALLEEKSSRPLKWGFTGAEDTFRSPVTGSQSGRAQQRSPGKERGSLRREQHKPVLIMDFSGPSDIYKPREVSLNETFIVSQLPPPEVSQLGEQASTYTLSPSRGGHPTGKASLQPFVRLRWLSLSAHSAQTAGSSMYAAETCAGREKPDIYGSPVRQSLFKARMKSSPGHSPHALLRGPREHCEERRQPPSPRSGSLSCPPQRPGVPLRMLGSHQSFQPRLHSPQSAAAAAADGRHRFRRHLSFDSPTPSPPVYMSPQKVNEEFIKLYHRFVCQNKSSFSDSPPCHLCGRSSEAGRGNASSSLAALALSPHRSVLRKRHREISWDRHPRSKRLREEYGTYSPRSKHHWQEMLRRHLVPSESERPYRGFSFSSSELSKLQ